MSYSVVHGLIQSKADVKISTASKVCDVLGLELRPGRKRKGGA